MKGRSELSQPRVGLTIAGIGVSLTCNDAVVVRNLSHFYQDFPLRDRASFEAVVQIRHSQGFSRRSELEIIFRDKDVLITGPDYDGLIDLVAGRGQLSLQSSHLLEDIDYYLRVVYALLVFHNGGLLFHAAAIRKKDGVFAFFGHSGSGKSTIARLSKGYLVLNDDLVVLFPYGDKWTVHGTPFWNPTQARPSPLNGPLVGLFRLEQSKQVYAEPIDYGTAIAELVSNIPVIPIDPNLGPELLERCGRLSGSVPIYRLHFLPDDSFWEVVDNSVKA